MGLGHQERIDTLAYTILHTLKEIKRKMAPPKRLLDQVRETLQRKHYARSTERTYVLWIKRFILILSQTLIFHLRVLHGK